MSIVRIVSPSLVSLMFHPSEKFTAYPINCIKRLLITVKLAVIDKRFWVFPNKDNCMKIKHLLCAFTAVIAIHSTANAAMEIDEKDFGPNYGTMTADLLVGKPAQLAGAIAGTALHVVGLPFSIASNSVDSSYEHLVRQPWDNMRRCVGCTPEYDNYVKRQNANTHEVRFIVDRPSEVIINTDQSVVVNPY